MTDIAQILGVSNPAAALPPPPLPPNHQPNRANKLQGVSREVLDILSGKSQDARTVELPTIVPTRLIGPKSVKVGTKWISSSKPCRPWAWTPFTSSARTDGLLLNHWVRANVEYPDYPYARFDIHLDPIVYSDDEYQTYLKSDDWTRSETDLLMELARRFELRWAVVHDRWIETFYDQATEAQHRCQSRRVEDLQHRYYSVAALLTQSRISQEAAVEAKMLESATPPNANNPDPRRSADQLLLETAAARALASSDPQHQPLMHTVGSGSSNKVFHLERERERREQMEGLWNRTKQEELEEAELRRELKQIEVRLRKLKKRGAPILAATGKGNTSAASSRNPSRSVTPIPGAPTETATASVASLDHAFASTAPTPMPQYPYLQSGRLDPPAVGGSVGLNKTLLTRMDTILAELKVPKRPLPTKRVSDLYDAVRKDVLTLTILQKNALQREGLVQARRLKLAKMGGNVRVVDEETLMGIAPPPPAAPAARVNKTARPKAKVPPGAVVSTKQKAAVPKNDGSKIEGGKELTSAGGDKKRKPPSGKRKRKADVAVAVGAATMPPGVASKAAPSVGKAVELQKTTTPSTAIAAPAVKAPEPSISEPKSSGKKRVRKS
jgi:DNA methyltransferase 1-associated protein 1